jgi:hypothetical protein
MGKNVVKLLTLNLFVGLQLYRKGKLYSTFLTLVMFSLMHFHASCYAFHHAKACIIYIRVVYTRLRRFVLINLRRWFIHQVMMKSRNGSIQQRCWYILDHSEGLIFSTTKARPGAFKPSFRFTKLYITRVYEMMH